jgi:acyl carrier protein
MTVAVNAKSLSKNTPMTKQEFFRNLEDIADAPAGSITGGETLQDLPGWNSLAVVMFLTMADSKFKTPVPAKTMEACKTVADLVALFPGKIAD